MGLCTYCGQEVSVAVEAALAFVLSPLQGTYLVASLLAALQLTEGDQSPADDRSLFEGAFVEWAGASPEALVEALRHSRTHRVGNQVRR